MISTQRSRSSSHRVPPVDILYFVGIGVCFILIIVLSRLTDIDILVIAMIFNCTVSYLNT